MGFDINIEMNFSTYDVKVGGLTATGKAIGSYATGNITTSFKDVSYLEDVKVANLSPVYSSDNTEALVECYYYSGQLIETEAQIITNEISADMETIWAFIYENWDSNIWELALDSDPTLKKE